MFEIILEVDTSDAEGLAEAIIDWREIGTSAATGFYSDEYYQNQKFPYKPKDFDFELKKAITFERNKQLNQYSNIYFNKISKNFQIDEL